MLRRLVDMLFGPWCQALDPDGKATCWDRVPSDQPALVCDVCWELLATHGSTAQRLELAGETQLPPRAADILVNDSSPAVRAEYAANREGLLPEHRAQLVASEQDAQVLRQLARRHDLAVDEQNTLAVCEDEITVRLLAGNRATRPELKARLATHPDEGVRRAAAA